MTLDTLKQTSRFLAALGLLYITGCASPHPMKPVKLEKWLDDTGRSALTSDQPSYFSNLYLEKYDLTQSFNRDPVATLAALDETLCEQPDREKLFVLSELCYLVGKRSSDLNEKRRLFLSSARYAYLCLFDQSAGDPLSEFDLRFRLANELYGKAFAQLFWNRRSDWMERMNQGSRAPLLRGDISFASGTNKVVELADFDRSILGVSYEIQGLSPHIRRQGVGLPFIGVRSQPVVVLPGSDSHPPVREIPVFAAVCVPQFMGPICEENDTNKSGRVLLETYDPLQVNQININDRSVQLEADFSGTLALLLSRNTELQGIRSMPRLLRGENLADRRGLFFFQPYDPKKIPVVFVHGLLSSPITWLPMINSLIADVEMLEKYQVWVYFYPTGNPILQSASELRESLLAVRQHLDPEDENPLMNQMVLVGHSMGGLVSRLMISTSQGEFLRNGRGLEISDIDKMPLTDKNKAALKRALKFDPVPGIDRVIFMATPHRGAKMAENFIGRTGRSIIRFPKYIGELVGDGFESLGFKEKELPTGIDNLRFDGNFMKSIAELPMNPDVSFHSIIGNEKESGVAGGTDGVVTYESSHLNGAVTESIYKSGHNVQKHPLAIREVRGILMEHVGPSGK